MTDPTTLIERVAAPVSAMPDGPGFRPSGTEPVRVSAVPASIPIVENN